MAGGVFAYSDTSRISLARNPETSKIWPSGGHLGTLRWSSCIP